MDEKLGMTVFMLAYAGVFTYIGWRMGREDPSFRRSFIWFACLTAAIVVASVWLTGVVSVP